MKKNRGSRLRFVCSTGNTPNTPQFIWPICPNWPTIWDIFEKSPRHMSIVHARNHKFPIIAFIFGRIDFIKEKFEKIF